jgi:DtxR family transcriptional regulator, Mn-dependent transcriptional regulator
VRREPVVDAVRIAPVQFDAVREAGGQTVTHLSDRTRPFVAGREDNGQVNHGHDLIDSTEMYLRTVLELEEEGVVPLRARIAERLDQTVPTVSQTVARMERDGLLTVTLTGDRRIELTPQGRSAATRVMRKHRLAECLLVDVIGLDWQLVHDEACRWEHVMSETVERRLLEILGHPTESPYGNPIPGARARRHLDLG